MVAIPAKVAAVTRTHPELVVGFVAASSSTVAVFVLRRAPVHNVLTLGTIVTRVSARALPEIVICSVRAGSMSGTVFALGRTPIANVLALVSVVTGVPTRALPVVVVGRV